MARIFIGPLLVRSQQVRSITPAIEYIGWRLELSGDEFYASLEVCRKVEPGARGLSGLRGYFVQVDGLPWAVSYFRSDELKTAAGTFLTLDCGIASLYRTHDVAQPLTSFLADARDCLNLKNEITRRRQDGASLVAPEARKAGFEVGRFFVYGTGLTVSFAWAPPQDSQHDQMPDHPFSIHAASIEFRPTPARTLGKGRWLMPMKTTVMSLLGDQLRSLLRGSPERWLSEKGVETALSEFKWTKVTLLTREELVAARIAFVRQHPMSHDNPRELARALKADGLWSDVTELASITKQVPELIRRAAS